METRYLINTNEPFRGYSESTITINDEGESYVDYSSSLHNNNEGNLTLADYRLKVNAFVKMITNEELDVLLIEYEESQITTPKRIDLERFDDMLNVLPPARWHNCGGFEVFHMSERLSGNLVSWFAHTGDDYLEFVDRSNATSDHLNEKIRAFFNSEVQA